MSGIGHNGGPSMEPGFGFRKHAWGKARHELLPKLPLQIVRIRVARAKRLGLDYTTYATIRATSGRDIVGFLFSGNALELRPQRIAVPDAIRNRLAALEGGAGRIAAIYGPAHPQAVLESNRGLIDFADVAPGFTESWSAMRDRLTTTLRDVRLPADGVVLVAATSVERDWCGAAQMAGVLSADRFFRPEG
ncbi:hypothetical protein [Rhodophyticola porphyridii]|uniref:Uncharacterized protein n=1 Tax=Rhodophyticola porphyridii TaxID=1852017 RepID=A0A3L9Y665_9RHOB|nr:hypothetical protein [Rhodophyticola porphyridii]RMA43892.1 hypothetical protein D9R08_02930 [Rhodophyticola porphyridii]